MKKILLKSIGMFSLLAAGLVSLAPKIILFYEPKE